MALGPRTISVFSPLGVLYDIFIASSTLLKEDSTGVVCDGLALYDAPLRRRHDNAKQKRVPVELALAATWQSIRELNSGS